MPGLLVEKYVADDGQPMGRIEYEGVFKSVNLSFVEEVREQEYVIVHAGFAITVLDQEEAIASLEAFRKMERLQ